MSKPAYPTGPVRLQGLLDEGTLLLVWCDCGHNVALAADKVGLPLTTPVPGIENRLRCSKCGRRNRDAYHPVRALADPRIPAVTGGYPSYS
jgi:hypothetical protein